MQEYLMNFERLAITLTLIASVGALAACEDSTETPSTTVSLEQSVMGPASFETDEGYEISNFAITLAAADLEFTVDGEADTDNVVFPLDAKTTQSGAIDQALHPGHLEGGQVLAELPGEHLFAFGADGVGSSTYEFTMSAIEYDAVNFRFWATDEGPATDHSELDSASAFITGEVEIGEETVPFEFEVALDSSDRVLGVPFGETVSTSGTTQVMFEFHPVDPFENDTLFDGIDFSSLSTVDGTLEISPGTTPYNRIKNTLRSHDHYVFSATEQ
jgi:hypothetical protein